MWKFRERRRKMRDITPPPIKSKIPGDFPPGWQRHYARFMEYKVIESLTSQPPNKKSVKRAVNQIIRRTSRCLIKIARDFPEEIINVAYHFIPRDPLSQHVLLVWASLLRIASLTPHDKQPILIEFFNLLRKTNIHPGDDHLDRFMQHTNQKVWSDTTDILRDLIEDHIFGDPNKFSSYRSGSPKEIAALENKAAFVAQILATLGPEEEWILREYENTFTSRARLVWVSDLVWHIHRDPEKSHPKFRTLPEPLLRCAALYLIYNSTKLYKECVKATNTQLSKGENPDLIDIHEMGYCSFQKWKAALHMYLDNQRDGMNKLMDEQRKLSQDTESLVRQALEKMNLAEREGLEPDKLDWRVVRERLKEEETAEHSTSNKAVKPRRFRPRVVKDLSEGR